ncbi:MAG TPA: L,D-transpeptidase, partial [Gammaproteobacteria bacterium]
TRILWLDGCEDANAESKSRFIYIHGTPDTEPMGVARSHGCVRMRNGDVIELFDAVDVGTVVEIREK